MSSGFYDTSSSVYADDFLNRDRDRDRDAFYKTVYKTPSPMISPTGSWTSESDNGFRDDVYKPYVTPPSPFESSTQQKTTRIKPANPYAQSLWYTFRGNDGSEIDKYKKATIETTLLPSLMEKRNSLSSPSLSQSNKENIKPTVLNGNSVKSNWSSWSYKPKKEKSPIMEDSDDQILKPLNNPPPYELISIESTITKKLKILLNLSIKFNEFIEENSILANSKIKLSLFSNIETLLLIHEKFLDAILNRDSKIDLEEMIYDHLQRLIHVYPSYLNSSMMRNYFAKSISEISKFKPFIIANYEEIGSEFKDLIISPSEDFKKMLIYLDNYMGKSSPRIKVLISKFLKYYEESINVPFEANDEPLFLDIPNNWKINHKINWKEISSMHIEKQIAYYLRWEIKKQYQRYCKMMKYIRYQIKQVSKLAISNNDITKNLIKFQINLPDGEYIGDKYKDILKRVEHENKQISNILEKFNDFINNDKLKNIDNLIVDTLVNIKRISNCDHIADKYFVDRVFNIHQLKVLFEGSLIIVFSKYIEFIRSYLAIMDKPDLKCDYNINEVIRGFQKKRENQMVNVQREEAHFAVYNEELGRVVAKGRLMRRFFS